MKTETREKIIEYIKSKGQVSPKELSDYLNITSRATFKQLKKLLDDKYIKKIGSPPKVYYMLQDKREESAAVEVPANIKQIIEANFITITPTGQYLKGMEAFVHWCEVRNYNVTKMVTEYYKLFTKNQAYKKNELLDGMPKLKNTFEAVYLDELYYIDFYSIEVFGKTALGQKLLYSKQSQNKQMIKELTNELKFKILQLIKNKRIDGVLFVPPTVKREVQFMKELESTLLLNVRHIKITKVKTPVIVPQKTLSKLTERIENARVTFVIEDVGKYKNILIIDDAVGSGATMNELARSIKERKLVSGKVVGLAITGSQKGFDVISEV